MTSNGGWKKPSDTMKRYKVKRIKLEKTNKNDQSATSSSNTRSQGLITGYYSSRKSETEKNPFAKRKEVESFFRKYCKEPLEASTPSPSAPSTRSFFDHNRILNDSIGADDSIQRDSNDSMRDFNDSIRNDSIRNDSRGSSDFVYLNEDSIQRVFTETPTSIAKIEPYHTWLPNDWSVKSKARFLSTSTFQWCHRLTDIEEDEAIEIMTSPSSHNNRNKSEESQNRTDLVSKLIYYEFPIIDGKSVFPRYSVDAASSINSSYVPREENRQSYFDAWISAFKSAFKAVSRKRIPFCYVCSQDYTALFRNPTVGQETECIISPATEGFKKSLRNEGIEITDPRDANYKPHIEEETSQVEPICGENEENMEQHDLEDEQSWQELQAHVSMDHNDICGNRSSSRGSIANAAGQNSAVLIRGISNLRMLYNHLLNSRNSITISGPQANLPPTILSPKPFSGSTLMRLKYRQGLMKDGGRDDSLMLRSSSQPTRNNKSKWGLDITGPILPHHLTGLVEVCNKTQHNGYTVGTSAYYYTGPFNNVKMVDPEAGDDVRPMELIRQLNVDCGKYKWNS